MSATSEPIGLLRKFTNRPALLLWLLMGFALFAVSWTFHGQTGADLERGWRVILDSLCGPGDSLSGASGWFSTALLWHAMTLAMMLPAGLPLISAYLDIAEAAQEKGMKVVATSYLVAGYCAVWLAFSTGASVLQVLISNVPAAALTDRRLAGSLLILAGAYQFAPLKHACLTKCRAPMPFLFARWSPRRGDIFRMGLEQGLLCLGCCFALMLLMLAAGAMNIAWMAGLSILTLLEKTLPRPQTVVHGSGAGLAAAGLLLLTGG
jgi:predicted metal-binding membrane protein